MDGGLLIEDRLPFIHVQYTRQSGSSISMPQEKRLPVRPHGEVLSGALSEGQYQSCSGERRLGERAESVQSTRFRTVSGP